MAFKTPQDFAAGTPIPNSIVISDDQYDSSDAAQKVANAY